MRGPPPFSRVYKTEGKEWTNRCITFINGMGNMFRDAEESINYLKSLCPEDICIHGIYNHSNSTPIDALEVFFFNYLGFSPIAADLLMAQWMEFLEKNKDDPTATILHICHSQGAIHTYHAVTKMPKHLREKIHVLAVAPAKVIPRSLCPSTNIASKKDFVPLGDSLYLPPHFHAMSLGEEDRASFLSALCENQKELIWIEPHENAKEFDHEFKSPTFTSEINYQIKEFFNKNG